MDGWLFDIEGDNLYLQSTKMWYVRFTSLDGERTLSIYPFRESKEYIAAVVRQWISSFPDDCLVVGHNILGYDVWMFWKHLGIKPRVGKGGKDTFDGKRVQFIDTYVLSQYLLPDNQSHSLEYLARGSDDEKMDYRAKLVEAGAMIGNEPKGHEFSFYHPIMDEYCNDDVTANIGVFKRLWAKAQEMYGATWLHASFKQMQKDYFLYSAQAYTGVKFDVDKAKALVDRIEKEMEEIKQEVDPMLPPRPLKTAEQAFYKMPAKPYTKAGSFSANMLKWLEKHNAAYSASEDGTMMIHAYGLSVPLVSNEVFPVKLPMEIDDNTELKDYFIQSGWKPSDDHWNFKRGADGKPERDERGKLIKTTPKIQHAGQICPNLLELSGEIPSKVVRFLSLRNRLGVVKGWLDNWRIVFDGRISAEISGYAPTSRVKHRTVCNVPKADPKVLLGCEMRDLFCVDKGFWYGGTDAAALENRTLSHYTYKYDDGKFARMQTEGDPHCYSEDTEILTESGWKLFGDLGTEEKVAQWDNGAISFVQPSHIVWQKYKGKMVKIKSSKVDLLVTPEHRVPYLHYDQLRKGSTVAKVALAKDFMQGKHRHSGIRFPSTGLKTGEGILLTDDEIRLVVAIQADAYLSETAVRFEFSRQRKLDRIRYLLSSLNMSYRVGQGKGEVVETKRFYIRKTDCKRVLDFLTEDKKFSTKLLQMNSKQARVFCEEIQHWDGTVTEDGATVLDTTCEVSRDITAILATFCNVKTVCSSFINNGNFGSCRMYRIYMGFSEHTALSSMSCSVEEVDYDGYIGCVSVPSTFVIVRRNTRIIVSGNTFNAFAFFPHLHNEFDINNPENKENPKFKSWRNKAKTGAYLLAFGGGATKLASSLGLSKSEGQAAYDNYWLMNEGLGKLKENAEKYFSTTGKNKYIPAIDGRIVTVRGKNVLLSCLGQGCGAIAMSYAACFMDAWLGEMYIDDKGRPYYNYKGKIVKRISMVHDEYSWEIEDGVQEEIRDMSVKAIVKSGEYLKLSLPLNGEGKLSFEGSWLHVH